MVQILALITKKIQIRRDLEISNSFQIDDERCNIKCPEGDKNCGGHLAIGIEVVYHATIVKSGLGLLKRF